VRWRSEMGWDGFQKKKKKVRCEIPHFVGETISSYATTKPLAPLPHHMSAHDHLFCWCECHLKGFVVSSSSPLNQLDHLFRYFSQVVIIEPALVGKVTVLSPQSIAQCLWVTCV
jgi:hypothetical protein